MTFKSTWTFGLDDDYHQENHLFHRKKSYFTTNNIDFMSDTTTSFTNPILFSQYEQPASPTDRVNKLADWFQTCSLDETKCKNKPSTLSSNYSMNQNNCSRNNSSSLTNPFLLSSSLFSTENQFIIEKSSSQIQSKSSKQLINEPSSSKILSSFFIFFLGLIFGYFLTNTFPPHLLYQWILIVQRISIQVSHFLIDYLQILFKNFSSYNRN